MPGGPPLCVMCVHACVYMYMPTSVQSQVECCLHKCMWLVPAADLCLYRACTVVGMSESFLNLEPLQLCPMAASGPTDCGRERFPQRSRFLFCYTSECIHSRVTDGPGALSWPGATLSRFTFPCPLIATSQSTGPSSASP